jgi:hypothetical protein
MAPVISSHCGLSGRGTLLSLLVAAKQNGTAFGGPFRSLNLDLALNPILHTSPLPFLIYIWCSKSARCALGLATAPCMAAYRSGVGLSAPPTWAPCSSLERQKPPPASPPTPCTCPCLCLCAPHPHPIPPLDEFLVIDGAETQGSTKWLVLICPICSSS